MIYNRKERFGEKRVEVSPPPVLSKSKVKIEDPEVNVDINSMKFFELKAYAKEQGMEISSSTNKADILEFLKEK